MAHPATGTATSKRKAKGWQGTPSSARTGKSPARASKPPKRGKVQSNNPKAGLVRYKGPTLFPDF